MHSCTRIKSSKDHFSDCIPIIKWHMTVSESVSESQAEGSQETFPEGESTSGLRGKLEAARNQMGQCLRRVRTKRVKAQKVFPERASGGEKGERAEGLLPLEGIHLPGQSSGGGVGTSP